MHLSFPRRAILFLTPALVVGTAVAAGLFSGSLPDDLDRALSQPTDAGLYVATIAPVEEPVTIGTMHAWTVSLTDAAGVPVDDAAFAIDGGMPQHGHGLPTAPAVTHGLGEGMFLIEGMKFNMPGWWEIDLAIDGPGGPDTITFNLVL
jgi:hypothetical protein